MQLRDHPLMSRRGVHNWPPVWVLATNVGIKTVNGEMGFLKRVHFNSSNKCFLMIDHESESFIGTLIFDDMIFCRQIANLLEDYLGCSIKEIGDLNVSYTF